MLAAKRQHLIREIKMEIGCSLSVNSGTNSSLEWSIRFLIKTSWLDTCKSLGLLDDNYCEISRDDN